MNKRSLVSAVCAVLLAGTIAALAQSTTFFTSIGDQAFPFRRPTTTGPGTIDNMTIGATTPRAGTFTTITSTGGGTLTADAINGTDASLGITGQAAAQGGAIAIKGGTSSTAANAGGAVTITGGTPGATGVGGAVSLTAGAPIAGAGSNVTVTASAGVGGTNAGGNVNLVPGAAVSTGVPGRLQVNGNASLMCGSYYFTGTPAATSQVFYIVNRPMIVTSISNLFSVAAGGTSTLDITKDTGTDAPAAGTVLTTAAFNLNATANTVQNGTLSATVATITLAAGNRLAVKFNHAIQASVGVVVTACMGPL